MNKTLGREHEDTLHAANNLAGLYIAQQEFTKVRRSAFVTFGARFDFSSLVQLSAPLRTMSSAPLHVERTIVRDTFLQWQAAPLVREIHAMRKQRLGPDHPDTLRAAGNLASFLINQGARVEAPWPQPVGSSKEQ